MIKTTRPLWLLPYLSRLGVPRSFLSTLKAGFSLLAQNGLETDEGERMAYRQISPRAGSPGTSSSCTLLMLTNRPWSVNCRTIRLSASSSKNWAVVAR